MNKQDLLSMMESAGLAYGPIFPVCNGAATTEYNSIKTGVQYVVSLHNSTIRITFRGTDSFLDAMTDLRLWRKTIPYNNNASKIRVHRGFINAYKSEDVRDEIHTFITDDIKKIEITGHSYGAALACLCAIDLQYNYPQKDIEVALFGSPRVGNRAFQKSYNKRLFKTLRVENGNDIITKVPFGIMGFWHVGSELHIGFPRLFGIVSFLQHRPQSYYTQILKML